MPANNEIIEQLEDLVIAVNGLLEAIDVRKIILFDAVDLANSVIDMKDDIEAVADNLPQLIAERGITADGEWIKYSDGLMVQTWSTTVEDINQVDGAGYSSEVETWVFPEQFKANTTPTIIGAVSAIGSPDAWVALGSGANNSIEAATFSVKSFNPYSGTVTVGLTATGEWEA